MTSVIDVGAVALLVFASLRLAAFVLVLGLVLVSCVGGCIHLIPSQKYLYKVKIKQYRI